MNSASRSLRLVRSVAKNNKFPVLRHCFPFPFWKCFFLEISKCEGGMFEGNQTRPGGEETRVSRNRSLFTQSQMKEEDGWNSECLSLRICVSCVSLSPTTVVTLFSMSVLTWCSIQTHRLFTISYSKAHFHCVICVSRFFLPKSNKRSLERVVPP